MGIFLIGFGCLFIPPCGWIISLSLFLVTVVYYATDADLIDDDGKAILATYSKQDMFVSQSNVVHILILPIASLTEREGNRR